VAESLAGRENVIENLSLRLLRKKPVHRGGNVVLAGGGGPGCMEQMTGLGRSGSPRGSRLDSRVKKSPGSPPRADTDSSFR